MLVLTRRSDEAIHIGPDIVVRVLGVDKNGAVKLGISAPRSVRILREELVSQVREVNRLAIASQDLDPSLFQWLVDADQAEDKNPGP
ncbi:MAG: carbon storage regulator [Planctomycetota bacterium]|nr:MAG: carbon storage regulator [Planctomycetota bacterium]